MSEIKDLTTIIDDIVVYKNQVKSLLRALEGFELDLNKWKFNLPEWTIEEAYLWIHNPENLEDDFNRKDQELEETMHWIKVSGADLNIVDLVVKSNSNGVYKIKGEEDWNNQEATATIPEWGKFGTAAAISVRVGSSHSGYGIMAIKDRGFRVYRNGEEIFVDDKSVNFQIGDTIGLRAIENQLTILKNGLEINSLRDDTYAQGMPGAGCLTNNVNHQVRLDNFFAKRF